LIGDRLTDRYSIAKQEHQDMEDEFTELEAALEEANPGTIARYRKLYKQSGGEQFRPDHSKVKCTHTIGGGMSIDNKDRSNRKRNSD
jgi:hypothetical protein